MPYKSFVIPVYHAEWAERELNAFVGSHRVLAVQRRWVDRGANSYWAVWVEYLNSPPGAASAGEPFKKKTDYRPPGPRDGCRVAPKDRWER
jgi:hypothetical protein